MIIMPDDYQPKPIERLLDWMVAYSLFKYSEEQLRNEQLHPPMRERLNDYRH